MIVTLLKGGLGNQMFQYAAGRRLAHKNNTELFMDLSWFKLVAEVDTPRFYELGCFNIEERFKRRSAFALNEPEPNLKVRLYRVTKGLLKPRLSPFIEREPGFLEEVLSLPDNTYLDGFWQNEKYFFDIRSILLDDFSFKTKAAGKNLGLIKQISGCDAVSLHVRRGDYATNKDANAVHGLVGLDYYHKAVELLAKKVKDPYFFVFSDDPGWCKKNLKLDFSTTYISHNKEGFEDMRLMQTCRYNIIANSSFSWWAAWLNQNPDKIVIAPRAWFQDKQANEKMNNIPKDWISL